MSIQLISKPGLTPASALYVPKDWNQAWMKRFIGDQLKFADVRNSTVTNGITISGNLASGYANIGIGNRIALGSSLSAWGSNVNTSIDLAGSSIMSYSTATGGNALYLASNAYFNGSNWIAKTSAASNVYSLHPSNGHTWGTAPSVSAGSTVNYNTYMSLAIGGGLTLATPAAGTTFTVNGLANNYVTAINQQNTVGQSFGFVVSAGTNSSDFNAIFRNAGGSSILQIRGDGAVLFPGITTTASAANAFLDGSNSLLKSTSSRRYKKNIRSLSYDRAGRVLLLRPVAYKSRAAADDQTKDHYGLIAEEVAAIDSDLVTLDSKGRPDGVRYDRLAVLILRYLQGE